MYLPQLLHLTLQKIVVALQPLVGICVVRQAVLLAVVGLFELVELKAELLILILKLQIALDVDDFFALSVGVLLIDLRLLRVL